MNKLGFYVEVSTRQWIPEALVEVKPPTILWHVGDRGKLQEIRRWRSPDSFVIGRISLDNQEQEAMLRSADPAAEGRKLADRVLNYDFSLATEKVNDRLLIDAWMSLNEAVPGPASDAFKSNPTASAQKLQACDAFMVGFRQQLQTQRLEAVAFNFAADHFTEASHYLDHFQGTLQSYKYLGFHEYGWPALKPGPDVATCALRYRACMAGIRQQYGDRFEIIITECGLARRYKYPAGAPGHVGWLWPGDTISQDKYWESLAWYNAELCRDPYVRGACLYQVGHGVGDLETFRHLGEDNQGQPILIISRIAKLREAPTPAPSEPPVQPSAPPVQPSAPPVQPPAPPAEPPSADLAGLKGRAAALESQLTAAAQQLAPLAQLAAQKSLLDTAAEQANQAAARLAAVTALQGRVQQARAQLAQRSDASPALQQRVVALQTKSAALHGRVTALVGLAPDIVQAQRDLQAALAGLGGLPGLQQQAASLLGAVKKLRADLDRGVDSAATISLQNPVPGARISQSFGQNAQNYKKFNLAGHEGIDYRCDPGTGIKAAAAGVVFRSGATSGEYGPDKNQGPYGIRVTVEHTWGSQTGYTVYAHLSSVSVKEGDFVQAGDEVGKSGSTGNSSGPHLHFSLILVGTRNEGYKSLLSDDTWFHDPAPFMPATRDAAVWLEADAGELHDEEIICLPPTRAEEM